MAKNANLKNSVAQVVKTNGVKGITGANLQPTILQIIDKLGGGYQFGGLVQPNGTFPVDVNGNSLTDQNFAFLASAPGTYTNFGGLVVNEGEVCVFLWDGTWTKQVTGIATEVELSQLGQKKLDKVVGTNLIDPDALIFGKAINWSGQITTVGSQLYCVSDYIPVNGQNIISNASSTANTWATYAVFDENKNLLRSGQANQQYTYQSGDYYVVFSWAATSQIRCANYGTTLIVEPYTAFAPLTELQSKMEVAYPYALQVPNKLDKIIGVNIINPLELETGKALSLSSTTGVPSSVSGNQNAVSDYIPVNGNDIIANAFSDTTNHWASMFIYDENKNFLRNNGSNKQYTYQPGDGYVRISFKAPSIELRRANYGTVLADYLPYTDFAPVQELQQQIDSIGTTTPDSYKQSNIIDVGVGYAFTDIQLAINSVTDAGPNNRYLIRIHDDFNITSVTQLWLLSNPATHASGITVGCAFIQTKDYVDLAGAGRRVKISVKLPAVDYSSDQQVNCHCVYEKGDVRISNIEFESAYTRYTMHEENGGGSLSGANSNRKKHFKNVVLRYLKGTRYNRALGIGTAPGEECIYENCIIESFSVNGDIVDGIGNLHSHPNYPTPFKYIFRNCIISSSDFYTSSVYTDIRSGVKPTIVFENCDFGCILDARSPKGLGGISLTDKASDWRNGGFYLEGHSNRGVLGRITIPCLYLSSSENGKDVSVDGGSAYSLIFGDAVVNYPGAIDAKGVYAGSQFILPDSAWSLQNRLGDCSLENKTLIVKVDGVSQSISLDQNYTQLTDSEIIADINSKLSGCEVALNLLYKQMHWSDNVRLVKNSGTQTIMPNSLVADNGSIYNVKLANNGDVAIGISTERINPGDTGMIIVKGRQYMQGSGVGYYAVVGTKYKCGDGGMLIQDNTDAAQFVCINSKGTFKWID